MRQSIQRHVASGLTGLTAFAVVAAFAGRCQGAAYAFVIDQEQSTVSSSSTLNVPVIGTLIGNYDAVTNPGGTRTLLGIAGGSGNQPISYTATIGGQGDFQSHPDGSFTLDINTRAGTASVSGLTLDFLAGASPAYPTTFTINYQTFHTVAPTSIFFGGVGLPIPLGDFVVTTLAATQPTGSAAGTLTPLGGDQYALSIALNVDLLFEGAFAGKTPKSQTTSIPLLLAGTLTLEPRGHASLTTNLSWDIDQTNPLTIDPIVGVPLDVPTIFPTGSTAHLLLSGDSDSLTTQLTLDAMLISGGDSSQVGDLNGDGHVDGIDLGLLLGQWGPCPKVGPCPADFNADGVVNGLDLAMLLANWG